MLTTKILRSAVTLTTFCCLFATGFTQQPATATAQPAANPNATLKSPEVQQDGSVIFRIYAPKASAITVTGDWIDRGAAPLKLTRDAQGVWSGKTGPLQPDIYSYSFDVDGVRTLDPKNTWLKPAINPPDMQFVVNGHGIGFLNDINVPHGEVHQVWYHSASLERERRMHIYTPPGYTGGTQRYPVLYLLHGGGDDDEAWTAVGRINFIMDNLIAIGQCKPMIVVMPNGFVRDKMGELPPQADRLVSAKNAPPLEKDLFGDIIPLVEKNYRVLPGSENRAITGLAVGGGQALWIATQHPDQFAYVGVFSSGLDLQRDPDFETRNAEFLKNPDKVNAQIKHFWIVYGAVDINPKAEKDLSAELTKFGIKNELKESPGGHTWINWRRWLVDILPQMFQ
jgi:enterochelin esterase family protein